LFIKALPFATAHVVWTGIGAAGTTILGMIIFKDHVSIARIVMVITAAAIMPF
jgi:multidrug transporter EmrE-like cation transporter